MNSELFYKDTRTQGHKDTRTQGHKDTRTQGHKDIRTFYKCEKCLLIFTHDMPDRESQQIHYKSQWKNNTPEFVENLADQLLAIIYQYTKPRNILDFGSGAEAVTNELRKRGLNVTPIDPVINGYLKDQSYPFKFNVVIGVEVIEHLLKLWNEIHEIDKVLTQDGIMVFTTLLTDPFIYRKDAHEYFKNWWYKDDQTHVNFFSSITIRTLARMGNYVSSIYSDQAFVLRRKYQFNKQKDLSP